MMSKVINIFVSYCSKDRKLRQLFVERLKVHLATAQNKYSTWVDVEISIGGSWSGEIEEALNKSEVGILLISPDFLASDFINREELPNMLQRREENGYLVVPVLLSDCPFWNNKALGAMQFFKTYKSEYGVTDMLEENELMPFDELVEMGQKRLVNAYIAKLAEQIDKAVSKMNLTNAASSNAPLSNPLDSPPSPGETLNEFRQSLLATVDEEGFMGVPSILQKIQESSFVYNKPSFANLRNQMMSPMTGMNPMPYLMQLKVFIQTLK